jgi:multiple sugar transport system ATP-binding protein
VDADGNTHLGNFTLPLPRGGRSQLSDDHVSLGVRPEDLRLVGEGQGIPATVELVEELGSDAFVHASVGGSDRSQVLIARVDPKDPPGKGQAVWLAPATDNLHWFDAATGLRLAG